MRTPRSSPKKQAQQVIFLYQLSNFMVPQVLVNCVALPPKVPHPKDLNRPVPCHLRSTQGKATKMPQSETKVKEKEVMRWLQASISDLQDDPTEMEDDHQERA